MSASGEPAGYALAYESGLRAVAEQSSILKEARDRAGALMSAAAVAGGLAAGLAFRGGRGSLSVLGVSGATLAVLGFIGVTATTVLIWRPTELRAVHDAGVIIGAYVEGDPPASLPEIHRELALWLGQQTDANRGMLEGKLKVFTTGLVLLLLQIAGMALLIGDAANG